MERKRNLPRSSRKTFHKLSIRQKRLHHRIIFNATINALNVSVANIPQAEASNNHEENKRDEHVSCCIESTPIINNDNNNISLIVNKVLLTVLTIRTQRVMRVTVILFQTIYY